MKIEIVNGQKRDYSKPLPEEITEWRWVDVIENPKPEYDSEKQRIVKTESLKPEGLVREYSVVDKSAEEIESQRVSAIKMEAQSLITTIAPEWKQRNMIAYSVEMLEKMMSGYKPTEEDNIKMNAIRGAWGKIQEIRNVSDKKEAGETVDWPK